MADCSPNERWLPVVDWEWFYEVSDQGNVRSLDRTIVQTIRGKQVPAQWKGRVLKQSSKASKSGSSYAVVTLADTSQGRRRVALLGALVLEAFVGPCPAGLECCHWNDNGHDNRLANLRWDTREANNHDQTRNGRHASQVRSRNGWGGEQHSMSKLTATQVTEIRRLSADGEKQVDLARRYGVSQAQISKVVRRESWAHV